MAIQSDKPKISAITSRNLQRYKLAKRHKNVLDRWQEMKKYMALAGKSPSCLRLSLSDYADIDAQVRTQSDGKRELADCTYQGVPVLSVERLPQADVFA